VCDRIADVLENLLRVDSHESYPKYSEKENAAPKEQLRPSTADSGGRRKLEGLITQESMKRVEIKANDPKERAYQYKVSVCEQVLFLFCWCCDLTLVTGLKRRACVAHARERIFYKGQ
jgi:hypothetical protein